MPTSRNGPPGLSHLAARSASRGRKTIFSATEDTITDRAPLIEFDEPRHRYTINGEFVPSVTQIIKTSDPFEAGPWWGMRVGIAALARLVQAGKLSLPHLTAADPDEILLGHSSELEDAVKEAKLTTNHVRQDRADEGIAIHYAIEQMSTTGTLPRLSDFDPEMRGFIQAFSKWMTDRDPEIVWHEQIVADTTHEGLWYCGKADVGVLEEDAFSGAQTLSIQDFKTSRNEKGARIYDSWHHQGRGYLEGWNAMLDWLPADTLAATSSATICLHESGDYLMEYHCCPLRLWLADVERWYATEEFLDNLAKRRNKSGKRRKR